MMSLSFGLSCIGFILLSLSLKRHYQQVWKQTEKYQHWLLLNRVLGYSCIFLVLAPCVLARGLWIGLILWLAILAAAAFIQAMVLSYYPQRSILFGGASLFLMAAGFFS